MEMFCPDHEICATCNHWAGVRTIDNDGFVHAVGEVHGLCTFNGGSCPPERRCTASQWSRWDGWGDSANYSEIKCWEYTCCGFEDGGQNASKLGTCPSFYAYGTLASYQRRMCHLRHKQLYTEIQRQLPMGCIPR